jgi:NTP pyrophosphatase (non-canonical NTP hydrolase)
MLLISGTNVGKITRGGLNKVMLTFQNFSHYNRKRCIESFKEDPAEYPMEYWALGLAGEAGEVAQEVKRLKDAVRIGDEPARQKALENLKKEIGDVLPYLDMLAQCLGYPLEYLTAKKFNEVSDRRGSDIKIPV